MAPRNYLDLQQAVEDWAWNQFDRFASRKEKKLREKEKKKPHCYINMKIDWSNVKFNDITTWTELQDDTSPENSTGTTAGPPRLLEAKTDQSGTSSSILFQTKFVNNTKMPQEYTMRTEKCTRSSLSTSVESGYTKGFDMNIKLMTPCEVLEMNAGYHREFTLTNTEGETFEEELTWGVESSIQVKEGHVAEAKLVVTEKKQAGTFVINSTIFGSVDVIFTDIKNNNAMLSAVSNEIGRIIKEYIDKEKRKGNTMSFVQLESGQAQDEDYIIKVTTSGTCKFRYGIKQEARVDQIPMNNF